MVPRRSDTLIKIPPEVTFHHVITLLMGYLMGAEWVPPEEAAGITVEETPMMADSDLEGAFLYKNREAFFSWSSDGWTSEHADSCIEVLRDPDGLFTFATDPGSDTEELLKRFAQIFD